MTNSSTHQTILSWLLTCLKPILRLCVKNSIKLSEVIEVLKYCYIETAREELIRQNERISDSRLSAMTGVHRKDVSRFQKEHQPLKPREDLIARVMARWQSDPEFITKSGRPKVLSCKGVESEFYKLVDRVNGNNINPYALMFEMERMGVISKNGEQAKLIWTDFAPSPDVTQGLTMLAEDIDDLVVSVEENIFSRQEVPNLHLKTYFDRIPLSEVPKIRKWILQQGSLLHRKVRALLAKHDLDFNGVKSTVPVARIAIGTFSNIQTMDNSDGNT